MVGISASPKAIVLAVVAAGFTAASSTAEAGGFAVREQSTSGLGAAFAGIAAGYDLSSIFWNPAGVSVAQGLLAEIGGSLVVPDTQLTGTALLMPAASLSPPLPSSVPLAFLDSNGGDFADPAV